MPKLNKIYQEYGCNKGEIVVIMDGFNIYHDKMVRKYQDSLGGIFPMLCVEDNLENLFHLKKDFPGAAPIYAIVSPTKEILIATRTYNEFKEVFDGLNFKKQPDLCDDVTEVQTNTLNVKNKATVTIRSIQNETIMLTVNKPGIFGVQLYTLSGKKVVDLGEKKYSLGEQSILMRNKNLSSGMYLLKISGKNENCLYKIKL